MIILMRASKKSQIKYIIHLLGFFVLFFFFLISSKASLEGNFLFLTKSPVRAYRKRQPDAGTLGALPPKHGVEA